MAKEPQTVTMAMIWLSLPGNLRQRSLDLCLQEQPSVRQQLVGLANETQRYRGFRREAVAKLSSSALISAVSANNTIPESIAFSAVVCLHIHDRPKLLVAFLDRLGVKHSNGILDDSQTIQAATDSALLNASVDMLFEEFPADDVLIYLLALVAMDKKTWLPLCSLLPEYAVRATDRKQ